MSIRWRVAKLAHLSPFTLSTRHGEETNKQVCFLSPPSETGSQQKLLSREWFPSALRRLNSFGTNTELWAHLPLFFHKKQKWASKRHTSWFRWGNKYYLFWWVRWSCILKLAFERYTTIFNWLITDHQAFERLWNSLKAFALPGFARLWWKAWCMQSCSEKREIWAVKGSTKAPQYHGREMDRRLINNVDLKLSSKEVWLQGRPRKIQVRFLWSLYHKEIVCIKKQCLLQCLSRMRRCPSFVSSLLRIPWITCSCPLALPAQLAMAVHCPSTSCSSGSCSTALATTWIIPSIPWARYV